MLGRIWGQTRNLDDLTLDPLDLSKRRSGGPSRLRRPNMGTGTMSSIPIRNVQRETFNSQLSKGVTERAHAGPKMGTDTMCIGAEPR